MKSEQNKPIVSLEELTTLVASKQAHPDREVEPVERVFTKKQWRKRQVRAAIAKKSRREQRHTARKARKARQRTKRSHGRQ